MGEHRTTRGEPPPSTARERRDGFRRSLLLIVLVLTVLGVAGAGIRLDRHAPASGYVTTVEYAEVRSPLAGQVVRIEAFSGDTVARGDLLVQLEDTAERAALAEAADEVLKKEAELAFREAEGVERRRLHAGEVEVARLTLEHARRRVELTRALVAGGSASERDLADDVYKLRVAEAAFHCLQAGDAALDDRSMDILRQDVAMRRRAFSRAAAAVDARAVRAPIDGRLLRHTFFAGEVVRPDTLLYEVFGGTNLILKLRVPERYATRVAVGQRARIRFRSDRNLFVPLARGRVTDVRDAIQTDGAQAFRVVICSFEPGARNLPPGATADAHIRIGRSAFWAYLLGL